jgi:zona occludens toxin (predicted ATPase)
LTSLSIVTQDASSRFFQLEELEDRYSCITEVFLMDDKTVDVMKTDGPLPSESWGTWAQNDDLFVLNLHRTFKTGRKGTDMDEFSYSVERAFVGEMTLVGENLAVKGSIHSVDDMVGDRRVGYFSMLDTTKIKLGLEKEDERRGQVSYSS